MIARPAVSVLMPVRNADSFLREALASILAQTFGDFELVAVDNGSDDRSPDILSAFAAEDERVRVVEHADPGIVGALNAGLGACRGEYVARMDADDVSMPGRLAMQRAFMEERPEVVCVSSRWRMLFHDGKLGAPSTTPTDHERIVRHLLLGDARALLHGAAMFRRRALEAIGGYREHQKNYNEELDLFLRLEKVGRFENLSRVLLHYRQHTDSNVAQATANGSVTRSSTLRILREAYHERGLAFPPDWDAERRRLDPAGFYTRAGWRLLRERRRWRSLTLAVRALVHGPLRREALTLAACSLRGH